MAGGLIDIINVSRIQASGGFSISVDIYVDYGGSPFWVTIYNEEAVNYPSMLRIAKSGNSLVFTDAGNPFEWENTTQQGAPHNVSGLRIVDSSGRIYFPETFFSPIPVDYGAVLRFTEIKLTVQ